MYAHFYEWFPFGVATCGNVKYVLGQNRSVCYIHDIWSSQANPASEIPDIIVDEGFSLDVPDTTRDITSPKLDSSAFLPDLDSPSRSPRQSMARASDSRMTLDVSRISMHSPMASPISPASRRSRRRSDMSMLSADMTDFTWVQHVS